MLREEVWQAWENFKRQFHQSRTNQPTELLNQITRLDQQIKKMKQDNPGWENSHSQERTVKGTIMKLEVEKSILSEKLAYQQNWTTDKAGYEKQLTVMTEKCNVSEKKLDQVRDLVSEGKLERLQKLVRAGKI